MTEPLIDPLLSQADEALAAGDRRGALAALESAVAAHPESIDALLRLASLRRGLGNWRGAMNAIDQALSVMPLDFMALLMRAHLFEQVNDPLAGEYYGHALAQAPDDQQRLSPNILRMLDKARQTNTAFIDDRARILASASAVVEKRASNPETRRLARFRDNILRRTRTYHSEPTDYAYPGLAEREFHDDEDHLWLTALADAAPAIRDEYLHLMASDSAESEPYVQYAAHLPMAQWKALNHNRDWTAVHLLARGTRVSANANRCPITLDTLSRLPQPAVPGYGPNAMFSVLAPGAYIPPHTGVANTRLVCHLPLIVPPDCWFRVGAETREWQEGKPFVFDDTIEHEAQNGSNRPRVVLIFDVWHPGLSMVERDGVAAVLGAGGRVGTVADGAL